MIQNLSKLHFSGLSRTGFHVSEMNRRLLLLFGICLGLIGTAYFLTVIRIDLNDGKIREAGVDFVNELSQSISLPLLEENTQSIQSILSYAAKNRDVITLSVFNHNDEMVTRVSADEDLRYPEEERQSIRQVSIRERELGNHENIVSFSKDITYAGTKIGELYVEIPGGETSKFRNQFKIATVSVFLLLIVFVIALRYPEISSALTKPRNLDVKKTDASGNIDTATAEAFVTCPLCGTRRAFSPNVFRNPEPQDAFLFEVPKNDPETVTHNGPGEIQLTELGKREDLSWLKRQVIIRCSEIIMKLSQS